MKQIVFFTRFPSAEEERDGFYQRVLAIDALFTGRRRTYVRFDPAPRPFPKRRQIDELRMEVTLNPFRLVHAVYLLSIVLRARIVYAHSILNLSNRLARLLFGLPFVKSILDLHGVVPEEFEMYGNTLEAAAHGRYEAEAIRTAGAIVVVTEAMAEHLRSKYPSVQSRFITLPIFNVPGVPRPEPREEPGRDHPLTIIYAGGTQKWQRIPEMFDAIARSPVRALYQILVPDPDTLLNQLIRLPPDRDVRVSSASWEEVLHHYQTADYGFVLRAESVVNRVACPTKLIEYLACGVVPILDYAEIGDFLRLGMRYLPVAEFVAGQIPAAETRESMLASNRRALAQLQQLYGQGCEALKALINQK